MFEALGNLLNTGASVYADIRKADAQADAMKYGARRAAAPVPTVTAAAAPAPSMALDNRTLLIGAGVIAAALVAVALVAR